MMDWSNESYVRIYVRDTTTWRRLGWDGQCVLMQVLRKVDRAGVLDVEDLEPWEAVVLHCGAPEDVARRGIQACIRLGVLVHVTNRDETSRAVTGRHGAIVAPKFMEAQEAPKSDRQRQQELRERRKARALVTVRDGAVTEGEQTVTAGHNASHDVTLNSAVLNCAVPESGARASPDPLPDRKPDPPLEPAPDPPAARPPSYADELREAAEVYRQASGQTDCVEPWSPKQREALGKLRTWCDGDLAKLRTELQRLRHADAWLRGKRIGQWAESLGTAHSQSGPAPPARPEDFKDDTPSWLSEAIGAPK